MTEGRGRASAASIAARASRGGSDDTGDRLADLEARLAELEHGPGLRERGRGLMHRVVPPEAGRHFRNAGRENLLGIRSIVDFWIQRIEESEHSTSGSRRETIQID